MIRFTQYLRPSGRPTEITVERPEDIEGLAENLREAGCVFEAEVLRTGDVSLEIVREGEFEPESLEHLGPESLAHEIVPNGPGVLEAVDRLVREAHYELAMRESAGDK